MKRIVSLILIAMMAISVLAGCTGGEEKEVLNVYNWGDYIDETVINQFEDEYGIKVNYEMYSTNEAMQLKLKQGGTAYDVVFPSDYMIERMVKEDMLHELDMSKIENFKMIADRFKDMPYDPGNKYSVPYTWGTIGIVYDKTKVTEPVDSWDILWDEKYKGQILMIDSPRDSIAVALKKLGYSMNSSNPQELEEAKKALIEQKPLVKAYVEDNVKPMMISGEAQLAVVWSGEAFWMMEENENLEFALPKQGTNLWFDSMVIPKTAQNVEGAHKFIDFLSRADITMKNTEYIGYSITNEETIKSLSPEMVAHPATYPSEEDVKDCEVFVYLGDALNDYIKIWTEIKAH